jgi:hypothetical protein
MIYYYGSIAAMVTGGLLIIAGVIQRAQRR